MLVLTRKLQEQLRIGDNVTVTVLRVKGNTVRLGIEAPRDVSILRGELPRFDDDAEAPAETGEVKAEVRVNAPEGSRERLGPQSAKQSPADDDADEPQVISQLSPQGRSLAARVEQCLQRTESLDVYTDSCHQS